MLAWLLSVRLRIKPYLLGALNKYQQAFLAPLPGKAKPDTTLRYLTLYHTFIFSVIVPVPATFLFLPFPVPLLPK